MSEKFTKGPWVYESSICRVSANYTDTVCSLGDNWVTYINAEANAALIAAAPEMYKEIKQDIEWLERMKSIFVIGSTEFRSCCLRIKTKKELLAKARGEA